MTTPWYKDNTVLLAIVTAFSAILAFASGTDLGSGPIDVFTMVNACIAALTLIFVRDGVNSTLSSTRSTIESFLSSKTFWTAFGAIVINCIAFFGKLQIDGAYLTLQGFLVAIVTNLSMIFVRGSLMKGN